MKQLLETGPGGIEAKTKQYARKKGIHVRKFSSPANRGVPDDLFVMPWGETIYIEFKSPGKKPTHKQEYEINLLLAQRAMVYVVDNIGGVGLDKWKKDFKRNICIQHCGYKLIDNLLEQGDPHVD